MHRLLCLLERIRRSSSETFKQEAGRRKPEDRETHPFDRPLQRLLRLLKAAGLTGVFQWRVRGQLALLPPRRIFGSNTCHPSLDSSLSSFLPPAFRHLIIRGGTDRRREPCVESTEKPAALPTASPRAFRTRSVGHGMFLYRGEGKQPHLVSDSRLLGGIQPAFCFQFKRKAPCGAMHCTRVSNHHHPLLP